MIPTARCLVALLAMVTGTFAGQQPKPNPKAGVTAGGEFLGRSGKPMAKTRLILGEVAGDQDLVYAKIKLAADPPTAVTDEKGRFQFTGLIPGLYAILYQPTTASNVLPATINIKALSAVGKSPFPLIRNAQIGDSGDPYPDRVWGRTFTLLKGHTFFAEGPDMKIWNATARWGQQGPYLEIRRGVVVQDQFTGKSPIKLVAWSY